MRAREKMDEYVMPRVRRYLFGVVNEGSGTQHNFVFHEPGKSNSYSAISMLHEYLEHQVPALGTFSVLRISVDSCSGQNKNNAVVSYLEARVAASCHEKIHMSFMAKGHTKFSVDNGFVNNGKMLK